MQLLCGAKRLDHLNLSFYNVHILKIRHLIMVITAIIMFKAPLYVTNECTTFVQNTLTKIFIHA